MLRWDLDSDLRHLQKVDRILRLFDWEFRQKFEHLEEWELSSKAGVSKIISIMDRLAGIHGDDEMRAAIKGALYEHARKKGESILQFVTRRDQQFGAAARFQVQLPSRAKEPLLEEGDDTPSRVCRT